LESEEPSLGRARRDGGRENRDSIFDIICVECERDPVLKHYGMT